MFVVEILFKSYTNMCVIKDIAASCEV